jgi:L-aminopeptidase/D-esterase-like protein
MPGSEAKLAPPSGVSVGHATDAKRRSGVTVLRFDPPARVVADARGPASGTYDIASLEPTSTFGRRDALFFAGGSLYGLDAAIGIRRRLLEEGRASRVPGSTLLLPRISGAILFDLPRIRGQLPEYSELGYEAMRSAHRARIPEGAVGAGTGARVAKYAGAGQSQPGGVGIAVRRLRSRKTLFLLAVFNSGGALRHPGSSEWIALARAPDGRPTYPGPGVRRRTPMRGRSSGTTLAAAVTDLPLDRRELSILCHHLHNAIARTAIPSHTAFEGDTVFAASTSQRSRPEGEPLVRGAEMDALGLQLAEMMGEAAGRSVGGSRGR